MRSANQRRIDKKHKKSEDEDVSHKSLLKICKRSNEKRRRDQENTFIDELAKLTHASMSDMNKRSVKSSIKPDKCAILHETVKQIERIQKQNKQRKAEENSSEAVQQSQVSSSKPALYTNEILGPLLLEALDGFLFMVDARGKIKFVSENVKQHLKYSQDELIDKSIYNFISVGDHSQFSSSLVPMSLGNYLHWNPENINAKSRTFNCRMLIKPPGEVEDDMLLKQSHIPQHEFMQISAILYTGDKDVDTSPESENESFLVCIARRADQQEKPSGMLGIDQFTTKQDLSGTILDFDSSSIKHGHYKFADFQGKNIKEFCHVNDIQQLTKHYQEVIKNGSNTSGVYRFKVQENRYVFVQTKSKFLPKPANDKSGCVVSMHSIVRECDTETELKGSASTSLMKSIIGQGKGRETNNSTSNLKSMMQPLLSPQNNNALLLGGGSMTTVPCLPSYQSSGASKQHSGADTVNLEDVLSMLQSANNNWDAMLGMTSSSYNLAGQQAAPLKSPLGHPQINQVSWSSSLPSQGNANALMSPPLMAAGQPSRIPQAGRPGRPSLHINLPRSSSVGSVKSPGSFQGSQRSPGMAQSPSSTPGPLRSPAITTRTPGSQSKTGWNAAQSPLAALQFMESQAGLPANQVPQNMSHQEQSKLMRNVYKTDSQKQTEVRLRELLRHQQESGPSTSSGLLLQLQQPKSASSNSSRQNMQASPRTFMPATSPLQQPQSTSTEDHPDSTGKGNEPTSANALLAFKQENVILKQLLSSEEGEKQQTAIKTEDSPTGSSNLKDLPDDSSNEAEPKKTDNVLLKKLLNYTKMDIKEESREKLLHHLLGDDDKSKDGSDISSSTTQVRENNFSTATSNVNMTGTSVEPVSSAHRQRSASAMSDDSILSQLIRQEGGAILETASVSETNAMATFLDMLDESDQTQRGVKRKCDSTDDGDTEPSTSSAVGACQPSQLSKRNVLLTQLLSQKPSKENVVNTQHTINPLSMPQAKLPKNIHEKLIDKESNDTGGKLASSPGSANRTQLTSGKKPTVWDNPRTNPDTPYPGNTNRDGKDSKQPSSKGILLNSASAIGSLPASDTSQVSSTSSGSKAVSTSGAADPLLSQILMQSAEMESDLLQGQQQLTGVPMEQSNDDLMIQLEQILSTSTISFSEIDTLLANISAANTNTMAGQFNPSTSSSASSDMNEQMAINEIRQQLEMSVDSSLPIGSAAPSLPLQHSPQSLVSVLSQHGLANRPPAPMQQNTVPNHPALQNQQAQLQTSPQMSQIRPQMHQAISQQQFPATSNMIGLNQQQPQQQVQQPMMAQQQIPQFSQQQARFYPCDYMSYQQCICADLSSCQDPSLPKVLTSARSLSDMYQLLIRVAGYYFVLPVEGMTPQSNFATSMANSVGPQTGLLPQSAATGHSQVRQHLLHQQHQKRVQQLAKQQLQQQQQQQQLRQQQIRMQLQQQQRNQQFPQRFPPQSPVGGILENFGELMNTNMAPNVSLEPNQALPGPMSPRFVAQNQMPNFGGGQSPRAQGQQPPQWNARPNQAMMAGGGMVPTSPSFADNQQFAQPGSLQNQIAQQRPQQQSLFSPNKHPGQRTPSIPGPTSPFPGQDPILLSPARAQPPLNVSPNHLALNKQQSQVSPLGQRISPNPGQTMASLSPLQQQQAYQHQLQHQQTAVEMQPGLSPQQILQQQQHQALQNQQAPGLNTMQTRQLSPNNIIARNALLTSLNPPPERVQPQKHTVHQRLRDMVNSRSHTQQLSLNLEPQNTLVEEIPMDVFESITELEQQQQQELFAQFSGKEINGSNSKMEEDAIGSTREEAKQRYEKFKQLANAQQVEQPDMIATQLFSTQLKTPTVSTVKTEHVSSSIKKGNTSNSEVKVVLPGARPQVEEIKPANQSESLLQQLLSSE